MKKIKVLGRSRPIKAAEWKDVKDLVKKIIKEGTKIILTADSQSKIVRFDVPINIEIIEPEQELTYGDIKISALPAYNLDKPFHPKDEIWVGYLIKINNLLIYHAGDTDVIPEMENLGEIDVALLPSGDTYTMDNADAAEAALIIKPRYAVPMHTWDKSTDEFKEKVESSSDIKVIQLTEGDEFTLD